MSEFYDSKAPKKATNASVNSHLLQQAKMLKINLSATLERTLTHQVRRARWLKDNRTALADYNDFVEKHAVLSDGLRQF